MKRGFYTIMSAQFFSSLADNALFVTAVELLRTGGAPEWQSAALVPMFALFYVVLAPFVGAFADALPKGRVMFISNAIKVVGCLLMLFGHHPLLAYAVVGLGAAAYSPAKYGILTELLPASQLVKANGWIEGLTITSIILGVLLGGQLVGPAISTHLLALNLVAMHGVPNAQARAQLQIAQLKHAFQQQDGAAPVQAAQAQGLFQLQHRKAISRTQAFKRAFNAMAVGIGLGHAHQLGVWRCAAHALQVVANRLGMDGGKNGARHVK